MLGRGAVVAEIVCLCADYREEGVSLFPDVFLTENMDRFLKSIPLNNKIKLGITTCDEVGMKNALKKTAPLSRGVWKMYFSPNEQGKSDFGVFHDSAMPTKVPFERILFENQDPKLDIENTEESAFGKYIRIRKTNKNTVTVTTCLGEKAVVHFSNQSPQTIDDDENNVLQLCDMICSELDEDINQTCRSFLEPLLISAIRDSHGTLIVVLNDHTMPSFFSDPTVLDPTIDIGETVKNTLGNKEYLPQLSAISEIIRGMISCDGIVIFNTKAKVIAYNVFVRTSDAFSTAVPGGARRRAFESLCSQDHEALKAVFFQSQDGDNEYRRMANE